MALIDLEITRRSRYAEGREFGEVGPYIVEHGVATYALDPDGPDGDRIVDLRLAPRDEQGRVVFRGDIRLLRPFMHERAAGIGLIDVVNRGNPLTEKYLNHYDRPVSPELTDPEPGDGFVFEQGWTILNVGWQHDLVDHPALYGLWAPCAQHDDGTPLVSWVSVELSPATNSSTLRLAPPGHTSRPPLDRDDSEATLVSATHQYGPWEAVPRDAWSFATDPTGEVIASDRHIHLDGGFETGRFYSVRYRTSETPIGGVAMTALRDAARWLRGAPGVEQVLGFGLSQTGRLLRHLCSTGLNERDAFDGLHIHIAGARRGEFNDRQGSPGALLRPSLATIEPYDDSLFDPLRDGNAMPKVIVANTSTEYWRSDASLVHTDLAGTTDLPPADDVRIYHHSGTQHVPNPLPQTNVDPLWDLEAAHGFNVVDDRVLIRAEMVALAEWVSGIADAPPSRHPRIDDGTLTTRGEVCSALNARGVGGLDLESLPVIGRLKLGPEATDGIVTYPVTPADGERFRSLVPSVDSTGNELGGVALPSVAAPVAVHTGWNVHAARPTLAAAKGISRFESPAVLAERHGDRARYLARVGEVADQLIAERRLLAPDRQRSIDDAAAHWDAAHG